MTTADIQRIEQSLQIELPSSYKQALLEQYPWSVLEEQMYFAQETDYLIETNTHLLDPPPPQSPSIENTFLGSAKHFWRSISGAVRREHSAREWYEEWVTGRRFYIGSDYGEEEYFIVLTETNPAVYCYYYELKSNDCRVIAASIPEWIVEVKRRYSEEGPSISKRASI
jgi:anthranilate/para-aminobenzoate synthase component I